MSAPPEYRGLVAQAWDPLRGDTSAWPDRAFYKAMILAAPGPALDVGCGTGRLLLDYLGEGLDVDGVDNAPDMLALCRAKAASIGLDIAGRLHEQEMDALRLPRTYRTILVPSSTFQLLTDTEAAAAALRRFHAHLVPGGRLVMSIMSKLWPGRRTPGQMIWSDWFPAGEARRADGAVIRRRTRAAFDHEAQLHHEENLYEVIEDGVVVDSEHHVRSPSTRWYGQDQIVDALEGAGFRDIALTSGFSFDPATPEDTLFCVIGTRP